MMIIIIIIKINHSNRRLTKGINKGIISYKGKHYNTVHTSNVDTREEVNRGYSIRIRK